MTDVYWIRLLCNTFDDERMAILDSLPESDAVQLIYVKMIVIAKSGVDWTPIPI
jgi:hypothetical protein